MTTPESYQGRGIDFDGAYGNQCVDLANQYAHDNGLPTFSGGAAADMFGEHPEAYTWVQNSPTAVPPAGSIVIWGRGIGPYGHIALVRGGCTTSTLLTEDQNWNGHSYVEPVTHSYNAVIGWGIPKNNAGVPAQGGEDMIPDADNEFSRWNDLHHRLRGRYSDRPTFQAAAVGKTWLSQIELLSDDPEANNWMTDATVGAVAVRDNWEGQIHTLSTEFNNDEATIATLKKQIADVTTKPVPPVAAPPVVKPVDTPVQKPIPVSQYTQRSFWDKLNNLIRNGEFK